MRARLLLAVLALALPLAGLAVPADPADANTLHYPPLAGFEDMVVDEAHGHVFLSQGTAASDLVVTDLDGVTVATVQGLPGARGMALSEDGSTLYVAVSGLDAIAVVDASTLSVQMLGTDDGTCPTDVAVTAGMLWFSTSYCDQYFGTIGAVDLDTGVVSLNLATGFQEPSVEALPARPDVLVVRAMDSSYSTLSLYDVATSTGAGPTLSLRASREIDVGVTSPDVEFTPDGMEVIDSSGSVWSLSDLSPSGTFVSTDTPHSVAARADGMVAIGTMGVYGADVFVYEAETKTLLRKYYFDSRPTEVVLWRGVEFGPTNLYVVTKEYLSDGIYKLRVLTPRKASKVTVKTDRWKYAYEGKALITARLTGVGPDAADRSLSIYATPYGGKRIFLKRAAVDSNGEVKATFRVRKRTTFEAIYTDDDVYDSAQASRTVDAAAAVADSISGYRRTVGRWHVFKLSDTAWVKGKVWPNHAGDCIHFLAQFKLDGQWRTGKRSDCVPMNARSVGTAYMTGRKSYLGIPIRVHAEWLRTEENLPAEGPWLYVRFVR